MGRHHFLEFLRFLRFFPSVPSVFQVFGFDFCRDNVRANKMGDPARESPIMKGLPKSFYVTSHIGCFAEKL